MHLFASNRVVPSGTGRLAVVLAGIAVGLAAAPAAEADSYGDFCPPNSGTMSLAPGNAGMCIHGVGSHAVTVVHGWRENNGSAEHCVGVHSSYSATASHVIGYSCGIGSSPDGHRVTDYVASGRTGYPIHKSNATVTLSGFKGGFSFVTGTLLASARSTVSFKAKRAAAAVPAGVREEFGVFRRPRASSDGLGRAQQGPALDEIYVDQTRAVKRGSAVPGVSKLADDSRVWVAAGTDDRVCLLTMAATSDGPASQCLTEDLIAAGKQLLTTEWSDTDVAAAGMVPDGVSTVLLLLKDGRVLTLPVRDNVYRARLDSGVRSVTFTAADGSTVTHTADAT